jgi:DNA-directed RNA polymerase II subunit RPB2
MESSQITAVQVRQLAEKMIHSYFTTQDIPLTKHHIDSYDQFLERDMINIIRANNPILILKDKLPDGDSYKYRVEIFVGGLEGTDILIGSPTLLLEKGNDIRLMYPNEARLRNLTYSLSVEATLAVRITLKLSPTEDEQVHNILFEQFPMFKLPLMLKSRHCVLNGKADAFLEEAGECPQDHGGYFVVDGSEKILITRQEGAFNTLYVSEQKRDPKISHYATITSLNPKTRVVKRVAFYWTRERTKQGVGKDTQFLPSVLEVSVPFVRKPVNIFVLFRALGIQSDKDILQLIFPDLESPEARALSEMLIPSITAAYPFLDTYSAIHYIKTLTKGFSEFHVLNVIHNMLFPHVEDKEKARATFLATCVRQILRVVRGLEEPTNKDDTRNQRLLSSGFLVQMLFQGAYGQWLKAVQLKIGEEYNYNKGLYGGENFLNIFSPGNARVIFQSDLITQSLMRGFKGKWQVGGSKVGEEKSGVLQAMSRLSYLDFLSHCRRVVLDFDTGMKLAGPRRLNPSQYGYFCTVETPSGGSIGITKNLAIFTSISTASDTDSIIEWLYTKGKVLPCGSMTPQLAAVMVPVYMNNGILGYTANPQALVKVLRLMKRTACLPPYCSLGFNIPQRNVFLFFDEGRPLRPLWVLPLNTERIMPVWRENVIGFLPERKNTALTSTRFYDPLDHKLDATFDDYVKALEPNIGTIEYVDPYEQNEILIANLPEHIIKETTHMEIHPTAILGVLANMIPFCNHNQSPRNHLSASQSKQSLSIYATNWKNRFDNTANVLCYGEAPLSRTIYQEYIGSGKMAYGHNIVLAMGIYTGYNQEDGIVMNTDALDRGLYRSVTYRTYETFEEDDEKAKSRTRIGNPAQVHAWLDLDPALDYSKLDDSGLVRVGEYVTESTVIVGRYMQNQGAKIKDASLTPQVWTRGRVEAVVVTVNNVGLRLVKVRVVQDRRPELGDKFCLTADHDVLTRSGWVSIDKITTSDYIAQLNTETFEPEYVLPKETFVFDYKDELYEIVTDVGSHMVSRAHNVFVSENGKNPRLIQASLLYILSNVGYYMYDKNMNMHRIIGVYLHNNEKTKVYCVSVNSEIFLAKRHGSSSEFWTGNSNRHGQKGTIGMTFRGHDLPRTEDGLVPDMIMNPHAIPSRMTIAQLHEQLFGKAAALYGGIANATAWMNEGSPHELVGKYLEEVGFEKTGNQILYNGQTGEQIEADIFIGNVYSMRLKHMTEDKWNARGDGRREQRTHQPTGGRGNQGGLKIGEMERDAIAGHGVASFVQESYMKRSDGTSFYICNGCGTIPIYNEKEGLFICSLCDGPIRFIGDSVNTLDPVPPATRSAATFSKIEMPYATKLFLQEMECFMNISCRSLTTYEPSKLHGIKDIEGRVADETEDINMPLPTRVFSELRVPEIREMPVNLNIEGAIKALQEVQEEAKKVVDFVIPIVEEQKEGEEALPSVPLPPPSVQVAPSEAAQAPPAQIELPPGEPSNAPLIVVDTSEPAMIAEGLVQPTKAAPGRPVGTTKRKIVIQDENKTPEPPNEEVMDPSHYKEPIVVQKLE